MLHQWRADTRLRGPAQVESDKEVVGLQRKKQASNPMLRSFLE